MASLAVTPAQSVPIVASHSITTPLRLNFDDDFRKQSAAVKAAQAELNAYLETTADQSKTTICSLVLKLQKAQESFSELSGKIIARYKGTVRELDLLHHKFTQDREQKNLAVLKAKQYRSRIAGMQEKVKILEEKASIRKEGVSEEEIARFYTDDRKRKREEESNSSPEPSKIQKAFALQTRTASSFTSSDKDKSPPRHSVHEIFSTPVPRAKRSNFSNQIPLHMKDVLPTTRLLCPNGLFSSNNSSHITSILQGLSATVKPHEAWRDLTPSMKYHSNNLPLIHSSKSFDATKKLVARLIKDANIESVFVDFMVQMQGKVNGLSAYPFEHFLRLSSGLPTSTDPVKHLHHILEQVKTPYIENAFGIPNNVSIDCPTCNNSEASTTINKSWTLTLVPNFTNRETSYQGLAYRTLSYLLSSKLQTPTYSPCPQHAASKRSHNKRKSWHGLAYAPEVLIFDFDQVKRFKVSLPSEHDFRDIVLASSQKTKYRLVTVIKKTKSGDYLAYVHAEDGKWWRCAGERVRLAGIDEWQVDKGGDTVMAFYEQLE
ncbi:hypothetical protein P280DRAFT_515680 [Massarina eburnea CBS 473.64]|uniref:USP domain-containing protein n=1 Tax=Massarina eburnea CBS 473.64 TaxID=1395130 RepID=A0A6A6S6J3_9PLEO|nr:hypothetical protein P280DRAFT_515680 [Massarina eburnea CBS 473.64]